MFVGVVTGQLSGPWTQACVSSGLDRRRGEEGASPCCFVLKVRVWVRGWRRPSVGQLCPFHPHPAPTAGRGSVCRMPGKKQRHFIVIFRHHHRKVNIDCFMMWQPLTGHAGRPWSLSAEFSHSCNSCTSLWDSWHCFICTFPRPCPFHYADILWPVPLDPFSPSSIFIIIMRQVFFLALGEWENLRNEHQI